MRHRFVRPGTIVPAVAAAFAVLVVGAAQARNPNASLHGSVPSWATAANFKSTAAAGDFVGFRVYLGWRNADQAEALARAVSDPASPSYRQYVTPARFRQQFAPSQQDVNAVQKWLRGQGFAIDYTPANNHYVEAEGTVAQAEAAFGVTLNEYAYDGKTLRSPSSELSIPSSLAGTVQAVIGLDQSQLLVHPDRVGPDAPPAAGFRNAQPCSAYWAQQVDTTDPGNHPYAPCGYTPPQLREAYGVADSGLDGSGVRVAIIDAYASPTIVQDANTYVAKNDPSSPPLSGRNFTQVVAPGTFHHPESPAQDPQGWYGEETLDVEAVHGMAPGADIVYVGAPNNYSDLDAALNHVVDRGLAQIVTNSYGYSGEAVPPGYVKPYTDTLIQAAAEGIGVYFSSGDAGDETGGGACPSCQSPDWPASSPWVTAVGGTSLKAGVSAADPGRYVGETGWSTEKENLQADGSWSAPFYLYGGGGGVSALFAEPSYQSDAGIDSTSFGWSHGGRVVPDVSMLGDPNTGFLEGQTQTFPDGAYYDQYRIGGTSLASPLFAGTMALADEACACAHGFANPALYDAGPSAYHDVTAADPNDPDNAVVRVDFANGVDASDGLLTSLRTLGYEGTTIHAGPGYDDMTGLGTPYGPAFLAALAH